MTAQQCPTSANARQEVLAERQAKGSADVGGMQGKYAVYPAGQAHGVRRHSENDLAVVRPAAVRQAANVGNSVQGTASGRCVLPAIPAVGMPLHIPNVSPQAKSLPPHAPVEARCALYRAHPHP